MYNAKVSPAVQVATPVRRAPRPVPTAHWVPTVGPDGRRRLSMQWSVSRRALDVPTPRAA
ncbi:hypothetical protein CLV92_104233 [Kineococcus xinjiangensis]|uniref:Uncharacterized protein n=1 Tax=Kineococcus xinjiangensis TaxID=512762 RepID=A0A2S6IT33_9ACTN|nr:hypothetical protein CLV92_104233 [Kineococcus xinjiangensis]